MKRYSIQVSQIATTVEEIVEDQFSTVLPNKIINSLDYYFEIGEYKSIEDAQKKADSIKYEMQNKEI